MMFSFSGPAEVRGYYQKIRDILQPVLILIFMLMPWISINGQPMILFDVFNRHFVFFGETFYSHDAPLIFFVLILVILSIFIVTAIFGRLWCGWSCPQTVFLHALYNKVERLILGNYTERYQLFKAEGGLRKNVKILVLYVSFFSISWILAHSFVAYFLGADVVTSYIKEGPSSHIRAFTVLSVMTLVLFFNFTFFREKLCIYICPYGRFQNSLLDRNSLTVFYDTLRGEPRGKPAPQEPDRGDCIDCNRCVRVCPTKIDIRNGLQLECIACGKCIDACNEVMTRLHKPTHLIRYETGNQKKITLKRFRLALYGILYVVFLIAFIWLLSHRSAADFNIARAHQSPFSARFENQTRILQNQILLHLKNQTASLMIAQVRLSEDNVKSGFRLSSPALQLQLEPGQDIQVPAFIEIDETLFRADMNNIVITLEAGKSQLVRNIKFIKIE